MCDVLYYMRPRQCTVCNTSRCMCRVQHTACCMHACNACMHACVGLRVLSSVASPQAASGVACYWSPGDRLKPPCVNGLPEDSSVRRQPLLAKPLVRRGSMRAGSREPVIYDAPRAQACRLYSAQGVGSARRRAEGSSDMCDMLGTPRGRDGAKRGGQWCG